MDLRTLSDKVACYLLAALGMFQQLGHPRERPVTGTGRFCEGSIWVVVQGCSGPLQSMVHCPSSRRLENRPGKGERERNVDEEDWAGREGKLSRSNSFFIPGK